ncbi:hypothetical protein Tco_1134555 [Tanacetum coccineum]
MVQPILNPTEGKMLMMMDDEQKIVDESLVIRLLEVRWRAVDDTKTGWSKMEMREMRVKISIFDIIVGDVITLEIGEQAYASSLAAQAVELGSGEGKKVVSQATRVA